MLYEVITQVFLLYQPQIFLWIKLFHLSLRFRITSYNVCYTKLLRSQVYFANLQRIKFKNHWMQKSFNQLLEQYEFLCAQIDKQTQLLKQLSQLPLYRDRVKILRSIPGIGLLTAMEILLELQDVSLV